MTDRKTLQLRSSAATNMLELMTAKHDTNPANSPQMPERYRM